MSGRLFLAFVVAAAALLAAAGTNATQNEKPGELTINREMSCMHAEANGFADSKKEALSESSQGAAGRC